MSIQEFRRNIEDDIRRYGRSRLCRQALRRL
jgi:hypothetical protein